MMSDGGDYCTEAEAIEANAEYDFHPFIPDITGKCPRCGCPEDSLEHSAFDRREERYVKPRRPEGSHYRGGDRPQPNRWRCLATGCNPVLNEATAAAHTEKTGHRVAKWPVRSAEGKRRARERNKSGYYDKYNVGYKSYERRLG